MTSPRRLEIGVLVESQWPLEQLLEMAELVARYRYDYLWIDDTPNMRDPYLALLAMNRVAPAVGLGIGTINPSLRHPAILAASAATLVEASQERFILGLGCSYAHILAPYGVELARRASQIEESINIIRGLLSGRATTVEGKTFVLRDVTLGAISVPQMPLVVGTTGGPAMLEMSGRVADGLIVPGGTFSYYEFMIDRFLTARRSGAQTGDAHVIVNGNMVVDDSADSEAQARAFVAATMAHRAYNEFAAGAMGFTRDEGELWSKEPDRIPDRILREAVALGSEAESAAWLERMSGLGITQFVLRYPSPEVVRRVGQSVLPRLNLRTMPPAVT